MVSRKQPWRGLQGVQIIIAVAKENTRLKIPSDCDPILKNIILSVWKVNPTRRLVLSQKRKTNKTLKGKNTYSFCYHKKDDNETDIRETVGIS